MLLLVAVLFTVFGVRARRVWAQQSVAQRAITLLAPVATLALFAVVAIPTLASRVATRRVSIPAPEFSITVSDGSTINAAALRGRVVVLDFWATWCPACRREMPEMDKLYGRYQGDSRVTFWAVDVLINDETVKKAREFITRNRYTLPVAFINEKSSKDLGVDGLPSLIVMDKSGRIRLFHDGFDRSEALRSDLTTEIETLLHETMP
jgi:thiol-disulfide isomerase/thioredoxin